MTMKWYSNLRLTQKIIILLMCVTLGVMSIYSIIQMKRISDSLNEDAEKTHILLLANSMSVFAKSLWEIDRDIAKRTMEPLFESKTVQNIRIFDLQGLLFYGVQYVPETNNKSFLLPLLDSKRYFEFDNLPADKARLAYSNTPAQMISPIINYSSEEHRLIADLWWKENEYSEPTFLGHIIMDFSTEYVAKRIFEQRFMFALLSIFLSAIICFLAYIFLRKQIISPILKLNKASLEVAAGNYKKIDLKEGKDEIVSLSENFNFMVDKIEHNLNLIRGLSEASQEIVKCKTPTEVAKVYGEYAQKLVKSDRVEIWMNLCPINSQETGSFERLSDNKIMTKNDPTLQRILNTKEYVDFEKEHTSVDFMHALVVPLLNNNGVVLGMVEIYFNQNKANYGEEEVRLIKGLGVSLSTAIENYWHVLQEKERSNIERDMELAGAVQDSLLVKKLPESPYFESASYYKTTSRCGGDWFGVYDLGFDKLLILFGDVTGHGLPAALITAVTRGASEMLRQTIISDEGANDEIPALALNYLNECILNTGQQIYFMTMVAALIDFKNQKMIASSAGHTPPALISTVNKEEHSAKYIYPKGGPRLGFDAESKYQAQVFPFNPGDQVVFYTDGIIEAENKKERSYGMKKFKQCMESNADLYPNEFIECLANDAFSFYEGNPPKDDIALFVLRYLTEEERHERKGKTSVPPKES